MYFKYDDAIEPVSAANNGVNLLAICPRQADLGNSLGDILVDADQNWLIGAAKRNLSHLGRERRQVGDRIARAARRSRRIRFPVACQGVGLSRGVAPQVTKYRILGRFD